MGFAGDGGPPPESKGGGGGSKDDPMFSLYETITVKNKEGELKDFQKRIKTWYVKKGGKDKPILMLDPNTADRFTTLIHEFTGPDGKMGSLVRCISKSDEGVVKGCPICDALEVFISGGGGGQWAKSEPKWAWCLTGIDRSKWSPTEGKNKGKVYTDFRRLVLITAQQYKDMESLEEKEPLGWRGRTFDVTRNDEKTSYKTGTQWYPTNPGAAMTDEAMQAEFAERAADYGLTVEQFTAPFVYDDLLPLLSYEEALKIGAKIKGTAAEVPAGDTEAIRF